MAPRGTPRQGDLDVHDASPGRPLVLDVHRPHHRANGGRQCDRRDERGRLDERGLPESAAYCDDPWVLTSRPLMRPMRITE